MIETGEGIDWATGEALAFGSLLLEGIRSACPARTASAAPSRSATRC
jgi:2-oxoglutarate dehydrogenase complex dehydrogenase (E1) component-like enzyme